MNLSVSIFRCEHSPAEATIVLVKKGDPRLPLSGTVLAGSRHRRLSMLAGLLHHHYGFTQLNYASGARRSSFS